MAVAEAIIHNKTLQAFDFSASDNMDNETGTTMADAISPSGLIAKSRRTCAPDTQSLTPP